jgi:hypothetical protein
MKINSFVIWPDNPSTGTGIILKITEGQLGLYAHVFFDLTGGTKVVQLDRLALAPAGTYNPADFANSIKPVEKSSQAQIGKARAARNARN